MTGEFKKAQLVYIIIGSITAGLAILVPIQNGTINRLREENAEQQTIITGLHEQIEQLSNSVVRIESGKPESSEQLSDLLRLRSEVAQLKQDRQHLESVNRQTQTLSQALSSGSTNPARPYYVSQDGTPMNYPKVSWTFSGYSNVNSAVQSIFWAQKGGDIKALRDCYTPEGWQWLLDNRWAGMSESDIAQQLENQIDTITSFQFSGQYSPAGRDDEVNVLLQLQGDGKNTVDNSFTLQKVGDAWKIAAQTRAVGSSR